MEPQMMSQLLQAFSAEAYGNKDVLQMLVNGRETIRCQQGSKDEKYLKMLVCGYAIGRYQALNEIINSAKAAEPTEETVETPAEETEENGDNTIS